MADDIISDRASAERWLRTQPLEVSQAIASRSALRVLPVGGLPERARRAHQQYQRVLLALFRTNHLSWVARKYPDFDISDHAAHVRVPDDDNDVDHVGVRSALAAGHAATEVVAAKNPLDVADAAASVALIASAAAAFSGEYVVRTGDVAADQLWMSVSDDARFLAVSPDSYELISQPLWITDVRGDSRFKANFPPWVRSPFDVMATDIELRNAGFGHWIAWYRALLPNGINAISRSYFGEALDIRIATQPNGWWDRDPRQVNADISDWLVNGVRPVRYNLLMSADKNAWESGSDEVPRERFLEYTSDALKVEYRDLAGKALRSILEAPALFAYEWQNEKAARVGKITDIHIERRDLRVWYTLDDRFPPIPLSVLDQIRGRLGIIQAAERNRTHWAIKEVDLFSVLNDAGVAPNVEVADVVEAAANSTRPNWDFFISYSGSDEANAREMDDVLRGAGYSTFVQFRDFGVGTNLVREMQRGLAGAGRVVALYSPEYERSDHCQAEWSTAYYADPGGQKRKLVPFLLKPTELNPLARQIVYKSLVGLDVLQRKSAILEAVRYAPESRSKTEVRAVAQKVASPVVAPKTDGDRIRIDVAPNPDLDRPFADGNLHELPEIQREVAKVLLGSLPGNAPRIVGNGLQSYHDHLLRYGTHPFVGLLRQLSSSIRKEVEGLEYELWGAGLASLFESFFRNHSLFMAHFPLAENRERLLSETPINENQAVGSALSSPVEEFALAAERLAEVELTTEDFDEVVSAIRQEAKDLASMPPPTGDQSGMKITPKRRFIIGTIGFLERVYAFVGATASIAATAQGQALLAAIRNTSEKLVALILH